MIKKIIFLLLITTPTLLFSNSTIKSSTSFEFEKKSGQEKYSEQSIEPYNPLSFLETENEWTAFWITLVIAAIGVFSIYGFAAGIIAVAITYFATNGNKKAFKLAILGCIIGCIIGGLLRYVVMII